MPSQRRARRIFPGSVILGPHERAKLRGVTLGGMKLRVLVLVACMAGPASADDASKLLMSEGQWEIHGENAMEGVKLPGSTNKRCLTKQSPIPILVGNTCTMDTAIKSNTVEWTVKCTGTIGVSSGSGKITYAGKTMTGTMETSMKNPGGADRKVTTTLTGTYVGACPPG